MEAKSRYLCSQLCPPWLCTDSDTKQKRIKLSRWSVIKSNKGLRNEKMLLDEQFVGCWNSKFQKQINQYYFLISSILVQPNSDLNDYITQVRLQIIMEQEWERVTGGREMRGGEDNRRVSERFIEETTFLMRPEIELRHDFWRLHHLPRYSPTDSLYLSGFCLNSKTKSVVAWLEFS